VRFDLTDPATFGPALRAVRRLVLIRPPAIAGVTPTVNAFLDAAVAAGVEHVVVSSVAGAESNRIVPHHIHAAMLGDQLGRPITDEPANLLGYLRHLGRPARDLTTSIADHRDLWQPAPVSP